MLALGSLTSGDGNATLGFMSGFPILDQIMSFLVNMLATVKLVQTSFIANGDGASYQLLYGDFSLTSLT